MSFPIRNQKDIRAAICIKSELIPKSVTYSNRAIVQLTYRGVSSLGGHGNLACRKDKTYVQSIQEAQCMSARSIIYTVRCALMRGEMRMSALVE
jgi:hypothetical protein